MEGPVCGRDHIQGQQLRLGGTGGFDPVATAGGLLPQADAYADVTGGDRIIPADQRGGHDHPTIRVEGEGRRAQLDGGSGRVAPPPAMVGDANAQARVRMIKGVPIQRSKGWENMVMAPSSNRLFAIPWADRGR